MKNKKGFTLIELIVSFALITVISLAFFRTVLSLQQQQQLNIAKNQYKSFTVVLNSEIQKDFLNDRIEEIAACGYNCFDIVYSNKGVKNLTIDTENNIITYGSLKEKLPNDYKFIDNAEIISYKSNLEGYDSFIALTISVKSNLESNIETIKYMYQYDSDENTIEIDVDVPEYGVGTTFLTETYNSPRLRSSNGLIMDNTADKNIRFAGSNEDVNNYVEFGNEGELWRIVGIFDVASEVGGTPEKRIKLVRDKSLLDASWDSSYGGEGLENSINYGRGVNEWSQADIKEMLNTYYIGESDTCLYCSGVGQETCENVCTSSVKQLSDTSLAMIEDAVWELGAAKNLELITLSNMYDLERESNIGKSCTSGDICTDSVIRTTEWKGLVGLIYPSDYGYASTHEDCASDIINTDSTCENNNWLSKDVKGSYWTISPRDAAGFASNVWYVGPDNSIFGNSAATAQYIYPSVYLKPSVQIVSGTGSKNNPYQLSL